jgi:hypothetical protein
MELATLLITSATFAAARYMYNNLKNQFASERRQRIHRLLEN